MTMVTWGIFVFALVGRLADIVSTWLVAPKLLLEGNPLAPRFGWAYALASASLALLDFASLAAGIIIGTVSCLMAHSNMSFALISRHATGEQRLRALHAIAIAISHCCLGRYAALFVVRYMPILALAVVLLALAGGSPDHLVSDVGYGIIAWVFAMVTHNPKILRVKRHTMTPRAVTG